MLIKKLLNPFFKAAVVLFSKLLLTDGETEYSMTCSQVETKGIFVVQIEAPIPVEVDVSLSIY